MKLAETRGMALSELSLDEFKRIAPEFGADVKEVFDFAKSVAACEIVGGTGPRGVHEQIARARELMG